MTYRMGVLGNNLALRRVNWSNAYATFRAGSLVDSISTYLSGMGRANRAFLASMRGKARRKR